MNVHGMRRHRLQSALSLLLAAALLLGMAPAASPPALAAGAAETYTQDTTKPLTAGETGDTAAIVTLSEPGGLLSGNALQVTTNGDIRTKLLFFSDSVTGSASGGGNTAEGLADGIYELSFRTTDSVPGNVGFLVRYKDEQNYAGISIDIPGTDAAVAKWVSHANTRTNPEFTAHKPGPLKPNTSYQLKIQYQGTTVTAWYREGNAADYTRLGADTLPSGAYTGEGGFAIRVSRGQQPGSTIIVDNIKQEKLDGTVVREMTFEGISAASEVSYEARANRGTSTDNSKTTLALASFGTSLPGFNAGDKVNKLVSVNGGPFIDSNSPVTDNGTYSVKLNGSTGEFGLIFNYVDEGNFAMIGQTESGWVAGGAKNGAPVENKALTDVGYVCTADTTYGVSLEYSADGSLKLGFKGTYDDTYTLGTLDTLGLYKGPGKVGVAAGGAMTLYTGALKLDYTPADAPTDADPGLTPVVPGANDDMYNQNLFGDSSSFTNTGSPDTVFPSVNVNQTAFGMDGKALVYQSTGGDYRTLFPFFGNGSADNAGLSSGIYEFAFRIGDGIPNSVGFLARYKDEQNFAGLSIDGNGTSWVAHYSKDGARANATINSDAANRLEANTTYKVRLTYNDKVLTYEYMKEGDTEFTPLGSHTMSGNVIYTGAGGFGIRINGAATVWLDNIIQKDLDGNVVKQLSFNDGVAPDYEPRSNNDKTNTVNKAVVNLSFVDIPASDTVAGFTPGRASKLTGEAAALYLDSTSPATNKGIYTVQLNGSGTKYGLVFNYADADNYATVGYNGSTWVAGGKVDGAAITPIDLSSKSIPAPVAGQTRTLRIDCTDPANYKLTVSGGANTTVNDAVTYSLGALSGIHTGRGQAGLITGEAMTLYAGAVNVVYAMEAVTVPDPAEGTYITIGSDTMKVLVGNTFPHIYTYKAGDGTTSIANGVRPGQENTGMQILTDLANKDKYGYIYTPCATTSSLESNTANSATYKITATGEGVQATFTVVLTVEGNVLTMTIPEVVQTTGKVRSFCFTDSKLVSLAGQNAGAAVGKHTGWGPAADLFVENRGATSSGTYDKMTYALLYDRAGGHVAAIENNAEDGNNKYTLSQVVGGDSYLALSSNAWPWQFYDEIDPMGEEKPYVKIVIGGDENSDGGITWQDAGIAYREIMRKPFGYKNVKNEWMFIAMNMSSQASHPFVRVLDTAKALSYVTDGFGMKIMNKGYQGAGHDDSHGDYPFVGIQQGGADGFNYLINEGLKYGIKNGVHLNMTEFALDSRAATPEIMSGYHSTGLRPNWNWFDQAYYVDKAVDVSSGSLKERLDAFKRTVPGLDFIYVDVYQAGTTYNATQAMKYMNANNWTVGTEALQDFNQGITFVHWNTDLYYGVGGTQSEVMRFVTHGVGDLNAPDRALLGALMPGVADWRNTNIAHDGQDTFYRNNLPTKYLQYFDLRSWEPNTSATFSGDVATTVTEEGGNFYTSITKDGKLIAKINTTNIRDYDDYGGKPYPKRPSSAEIFIPWSPVLEDKIYCYSDNGGSQSWDLPDSWSGVGTAYLYTLTVNGRADMQAITPANGKVTLDLTAGQPYILVKAEAAMPHLYSSDGSTAADLIPAPTGENAWGQGSLIKDFGFTSRTLDAWTVDAADGSIAIDLTRPGSNDGNPTTGVPSMDPQVVFNPTAAGSISQSLTVEPGKTYTFSAWVNSEGARPVTLKVTAGDKTVESSIDTTAGILVYMKPSKYHFLNWQRLTLSVTIPEGVTQATLALSTVAGNEPVYADDFRSWEWPDGAKPNPLTGLYHYYEDFENLHENWGPFVSTVGTQPYTGLAYKFGDGSSQIKYYSLDTQTPAGEPDNANLTSLKVTQGDGFSGVSMRTVPSTLNFAAGKQYQVEIDYQTYREIRLERSKSNSGPEIPSKDLDGNIIPNLYYGYNYPLDEAKYSITVHKADGEIIATHPFTPSTFEEGTKIADFDYNSRPSTETVSFPVDAATESGIYLTVEYNDSQNRTPILVIDNFRVIDLSDDAQVVGATKITVTQKTHEAAQADAGTEAAAQAKLQAILDGLNLLGTVVDVTPGVFTPAVAGTPADLDGTDGSYTFSISLTRGGATESAQLTMNIKATAFVSDPDLAAAKDAIEGATFTATQAEAGSETAAKTKAQALVTALGFADGVTAEVITDEFNPATAATAGSAGIDGSYLFHVTLTKGEDTLDTEQCTMTITATAFTPDDALAAAKAAVESAAYTASQSVAGDETAALAKAKALVGGLSLGDGVTAAVTTVSFVAAVEGTADNINGTNGAYTFYVTLTKGDESVQTDNIVMVIEADVYIADTVLAAARDTVQGASYTATQAEAGSETAAQAKALALVNALALGDGVTAQVETSSFTAPVAGTSANPNGTNGSYVFTVTLARGTVSATTSRLTMSITATVYVPSPGPGPDSGGSGGSSNTGSSTTTTTNPDGSVTKTTTDKSTGAVTETTTAKNGVVGETVTKKDGSVTASATLPKGVEGIVTLPVKDLPVGTTVTIKTEEPATVVIPLESTTSGKVAYLVKEDGTRELIRKSVTDGDGVALVLDGSATVVLEDNTKNFADLPASHWAADAVAFATSRELFLGVGDDAFAPSLPMTRSMFATVLYRLENEPDATAANFGDVPDGTWYSEAVGWANETGIVTGTGSGFNPDGEITRESLAVMLYRYADVLGLDTSAKGSITDPGVSSWAADALSWAVGSGLMQGDQNGSLNPGGSATRAEVATLLQRFVGMIVK